MFKSKLKDSDEVIYRKPIKKASGKVFVCYGLNRFMNKFGGVSLSEYNEDLTNKNDERKDIMKVIRN